MIKLYGNTLKLGVLGGGQLGRMLIQAAISYDLRIYVMDESKMVPCGHLAYEFTVGNIQSFDDVMNFGKDKDVITVEIEAVNVEALEALEKQGKKIFPQPRVLRLIQDKGLQKNFYKKNNIPTAPFHILKDKERVQDYQLNLPFVMKARKGGYDGRGVVVMKEKEDLKQAFSTPSLLEDVIDFEKELSVLVARNEKGEIATFPVVECEFNKKLNLVEFLFSPAKITSKIEEKAKIIASDVIKKLDMVGLLAVELFLTKDGDLMVNEVAPRTHNSGHHTIESNCISQFEQHFRAILNLPLGDTKAKRSGVMINLIGADGFSGIVQYEGLEEIMQLPEVYVHLYGKSETRPGRKMGHVTITDENIEKAIEKAKKVQATLKVKA